MNERVRSHSETHAHRRPLESQITWEVGSVTSFHQGVEIPNRLEKMRDGGLGLRIWVEILTEKAGPENATFC